MAAPFSADQLGAYLKLKAEVFAGLQEEFSKPLSSPPPKAYVPRELPPSLQAPVTWKGSVDVGKLKGEVDAYLSRSHAISQDLQSIMRQCDSASSRNLFSRTAQPPNYAFERTYAHASATAPLPPRSPASGGVTCGVPRTPPPRPRRRKVRRTRVAKRSAVRGDVSIPSTPPLHYA